MSFELYKRPQSPNWQVLFTTPIGRRVRRSTGTRDKAIARQAAKKFYRDECERDLAPQSQGVTFAEAALGYIKNGGETRFLAPLLRHFGPDITVDQLDEITIIEAADALYPGRAAETWRRQVSVPIKAILNFAAGKRPQKRGNAVRTRWLTPEEAERLLTGTAAEKAGASVVAKVAFLLGTGCRTGEMFALQAHELWPATQEAWIDDPKNGEGRRVRYPDRVARYLVNTAEVGAVFRTPNGLPYALRERGGGQMQHAFNALRDAAGLGPDVTPHVLRHTWATWYYAQTRDFGGLMDLGGWKKADMANRYRKLAPADLGARLLAHGWDFGGQSDLRTPREQTR
ncbi:MAG: tyrosine-type recombinase/integrase [Pseudomonadota bacterium]